MLTFGKLIDMEITLKASNKNLGHRFVNYTGCTSPPPLRTWSCYRFSSLFISTMFQLPLHQKNKFMDAIYYYFREKGVTSASETSLYRTECHNVANSCCLKRQGGAGIWSGREREDHVKGHSLPFGGPRHGNRYVMKAYISRGGLVATRRKQNPIPPPGSGLVGRHFPK